MHDHMAVEPRDNVGPRGHPCGAPRGRRGVCIWRAHGYSGALVTGGAVTQLKSPLPPLFKRITSQIFLCVGLCSHTVLTSAGRVAAHRMSDAIKTAKIAWTRVHAIIKSGTCTNDNLSDRDRRAHRSPRDATRSP